MITYIEKRILYSNPFSITEVIGLGLQNFKHLCYFIFMQAFYKIKEKTEVSKWGEYVVFCKVYSRPVVLHMDFHKKTSFASYSHNFLNCFCKLMFKYVKHNLSVKILLSRVYF